MENIHKKILTEKFVKLNFKKKKSKQTFDFTGKKEKEIQITHLRKKISFKFFDTLNLPSGLHSSGSFQSDIS